MRDELKHTLVLGVGTGFSSLLRIVFIVCVGRILGPEEYGVFYSALTVIVVFATAFAPVSGTVSRFASLHLAQEDHAALAGLRTVAEREVVRLAVATSVLGAIACWALQERLGWEGLALPAAVLATLPIALLLELPRGLLRGAHRFVSFSVSRVFEAAVRLGLGLALVLWLRSAVAPLAAYAIAALLAIFVTRASARSLGVGVPDAREPDRTVLRRFAGSLFLVAGIGALLQNLDVLFVKSAFGEHESGIYSAASSLAKSIALVFLPFGTFLLPDLTARFSRGERLVGPLLRVLGLFVAVSLVAIVALTAIGDRLVSTLYGAEFEGAATLLAPLGGAMLFALLSALVGQAFAAIGRFRFLPAYALAIPLLAAAMAFRSESLPGLASALCWTQAAVAAAMLATFLVTQLGARPGERS